MGSQRARGSLGLRGDVAFVAPGRQAQELRHAAQAFVAGDAMTKHVV